MTRIRNFSLLFLITAALLAGCSQPADEPVAVDPVSVEPAAADSVEEPPAAASPGPLAITDGFGRAIILEQPASRIISLAPSNTEVLFAIGAGDRLIGRDDYSDYPEAALSVPSIGDTYGDLNIEAIVAFNPDLVLAADITPVEQIEALESVGLTVFVVGNPLEFVDLFTNIETLGALTGQGTEAGALVDELRSSYEQVLEATSGIEPVSVFYEVDGSDQAAPWTTGSGTFQQTMFDLVGGENIAAEIQGWGQLSLEEIVVSDPQVIIFGAGSFVPTTVDNLMDRPGWGDLTAVSEGRVFSIDTDLVDLPGPRLVEGLRQLAAMLHPDLFNE